MSSTDCPNRLTLTGTKDKSKLFDMLPTSPPTTPTSAITAFDENEIFWDKLEIDDEHKEFSHSQEFNQEIQAENLLATELPDSMISISWPFVKSNSFDVGTKIDKIKTFPKVTTMPKRVKKVDYKISLSDRPLNNKAIKRILFQEIIENKKLRCPWKKFENSFSCFTARDWINVAFELTFRPYHTTRIYRKYEYQEKKRIYESLISSSNFDCFVQTKNSNNWSFINEKLAKWKVQIIKDIPRTFSNIDIFNYASMLQQLYRILYSYFIYDPQLGYTQGMNLIVGALLMHAEESVAFWLFVTLIEDYDMRDVFTDSLGKVTHHCKVMQSLINHYLPKIAIHLDKLDIQVEMFATPWIMSLFWGIIPVPFLHWFLTRFFKNKWMAFYRIFLSILEYLEPQILSSNDLTDFFDAIKSLKMDQDHIEYEERRYVEDPIIVENIIKWRTIIKNSDESYQDIQSYMIYDILDYDDY